MNEITILQDDFEYQPPVIANLTEEEKNQGKWLNNITSDKLEEKLNKHLAESTVGQAIQPTFTNTVVKAASICAKHGYDPVEAMVKMAIDENTPKIFQLSCHKEVAKYTYGKAKPQDINQTELEDEGIKPITIVIKKYGDRK